jgi:hypothetical protein
VDDDPALLIDDDRFHELRAVPLAAVVQTCPNSSPPAAS